MRVLREPIGCRCPRFNDDQRRPLAAKAKKLGRKILAQVATIVTPQTLLAWHRKLIAQKYDGSAHRTPRTPTDVNRDLGRRHSNGRREWLLGLPADSRCTLITKDVVKRSGRLSWK